MRRCQEKILYLKDLKPHAGALRSLTECPLGMCILFDILTSLARERSVRSSINFFAPIRPDRHSAFAALRATFVALVYPTRLSRSSIPLVKNFFAPIRPDRLSLSSLPHSHKTSLLPSRGSARFAHRMSTGHSPLGQVSSR
jgi:hypothetical protein